MRGELTRFAEGQKVFLLPKQMQGELDLDGRIIGDLKALESTVQFKGQLRAQKFKFKELYIEDAKVDAEWAQGALKVERAEFFSPKRERLAPSTLGSGGRIKVGAFTFEPKQKHPVKIPLDFSEAHIQWLAALGATKIFQLDFRLSGKADVEVFFKANRRLEASLRFGP